MKYEKMVTSFGVESLAVLLGLIVPFSVFIGVCATVGRLPFWIARRLPDDLLETLKDPRSVDDLRIR